MFQDYKVVITGATSGIGLATARLFIREGATVIGIGRNFSKTKELGDQFIPYTCDVRNADEIVKTCKFIKDTFDNELDIINTASAASRTVSSENPLYNLAKNAVVLYTKQQAQGFIGVRCNSVSPGFIQTPIFQREGVNMEENAVLAMYDQMAKVTCGRTGKPEEVADLIAFLASTDAQYINGADVLIDGGLMTVSN